MEYYAIRIYRREVSQVRRGSSGDTQLTGLLEDDAGRKKKFRNAEELWRLLEQGVSNSVPGEPENEI
jgi:hypothetical protein